jgi:CRP-like cAMP-binding protein
MSPAAPFDDTNGNRLLAALPLGERDRLRSHLEPVEVSLKEMLYGNNERISHVYFIDDGVISLIQYLEDAQPVEAATVGKEGMAGIPVFLGARSTQGAAICQIPGHARKLAVERFHELVRPGSPLHDLLHRYTQALMVLLAQNSGCNRRHSIEQRCARWLCMTGDRMDQDRFPLTQEFLGQMLGVRRAGVSPVANQMQRDGLISYNRGQITILDRAGLEARSCDCYRIIRSEFERMLDPA